MAADEAATIINDMLDLALEGSEISILRLETDRETIQCTGKFVKGMSKCEKASHEPDHQEYRPLCGTNFVFSPAMACNLSTPPVTSPPSSSIASPISLMSSASTITATTDPKKRTSLSPSSITGRRQSSSVVTPLSSFISTGSSWTNS